MKVTIWVNGKAAYTTFLPGDGTLTIEVRVRISWWGRQATALVVNYNNGTTATEQEVEC